MVVVVAAHSSFRLPSEKDLFSFPLLSGDREENMAQPARSKRISRSEMMRVPSHKPKAMFGCRHVQILLMTLAFLCCYAVRVTMSVTLEAMTNSTTANIDFEEFKWDDYTKSTIQSSFFWGYICTQIPGSMITQRFGAQKVLPICLLVCGVVTLLIPIGAHYGDWPVVCTLRVIAGLCQGNITPTIHALLSKWSPAEERGTLASFVYSGGWIGNVICLLSSGLLSASSLGWPSCFYFWGSATVVCSIASFLFGKESPSDHPGIPIDEKEYIEMSLGVTETKETLPTPWWEMLTSLPVWALLVAQCAQAWGFWMLLTKIPSYMANVLHFDIKKNGLISALPYFTAWILSFFFSYISDLLIRRRVITIGLSRKICNSIGEWIPAVALIGLGYVNDDQPEIAVAILIVAVGANIAVYCGHNVNHMDLSPNFAGILMGITNTASNVCSIITPLVAGWIVGESKDVTKWRTVFFLSAAVYFFGNLVFVLFGAFNVQRWNDPITERKSSILFHISESGMDTMTKGEKIDSKKEEKIP